MSWLHYKMFVKLKTNGLNSISVEGLGVFNSIIVIHLGKVSRTKPNTFLWSIPPRFAMLIFSHFLELWWSQILMRERLRMMGLRSWSRGCGCVPSYPFSSSWKTAMWPFFPPSMTKTNFWHHRLASCSFAVWADTCERLSGWMCHQVSQMPRTSTA